jgi:hypothetical protein
MDGVVGFWVKGLRSADGQGCFLLGGDMEGGFSSDVEQAPGLWAFAIFGYRVRLCHPGLASRVEGSLPTMVSSQLSLFNHLTHRGMKFLTP